MITVKDICKTFTNTRGEKVTVLDKVSFAIEQGEFICLLGPSGCGKSTLLNILAGFEHPSGGEVFIDGKLVTKPDSRYLTIFQNYGLFPWRTVLANVAYGLENLHLPLREREETARRYIRLVGLEGFANHHPHQLSGGMQQRVALARALAMHPEVLFMDEPLGALDTFTRFRLQEEIIRLWRKEKSTIIFVTHDIEEAVYLAERIYIMSPHPGRIKSVLPVPLGYPRDRTSYDFMQIRQRVYTELQLRERETIDYYI